MTLILRIFLDFWVCKNKPKNTELFLVFQLANSDGILNSK